MGFLAELAQFLGVFIGRALSQIDWNSVAESVRRQAATHLTVATPESPEVVAALDKERDDAIQTGQAPAPGTVVGGH